jgi:cytoskeleton protein RodZ
VFDIGASLREARIKRGLSPADVHKAIRIRDRYLQALEDERWELLPGDAYVKGFLRTYADFLGLDGNLYIDEYSSRFAAHEEPPLAPVPLPRGESGSRSVGLLRPLLAIGAIVAIVAAVAAWQLNRGSNKTSTPPPPPTTTTTGGTTTTKTHPKPPVRLPEQARLVAARGACWVEVRVGGPSGKLLFENTLQQGQSQTVSLASGSLWMNVGDPPNLDVHLGGKVVPGLPSQAGTVVLTRHGLRS